MEDDGYFNIVEENFERDCIALILMILLMIPLFDKLALLLMIIYLLITNLV